MLEVDRYSPSNNDALNTIKEYVHSKVGDDPMEVVNMVRDLKFRLGAPSRGKTKLDQVASYVRIRSKMEQLKAEAKAMEL